MSIIPYLYDDSLFDFDSFNGFNRFFNNSFDAARNRGGNNEGQLQRQDNFLRPRMDIHESKDRNELTATFELPGMKKEDVSIDIHSNRLTVSGRSNLSNDLDKDGYSVRERRYGSFQRSIPLPPGLKPEDVKANMEHGVLTIKLPRTTPDQAPKKINIS